VRGRALTLGAAAALIVGVACGDQFLHTNPYDPAFPLSVDIAGPDTLFSLGEIGSYAVRFTPAVFADSAVTWLADTITIFQADTAYVSDGSAYLQGGSGGNFMSVMPPLEPATLKISVEALVASYDTQLTGKGGGLATVKEYRHTGFKSVVITQRVTRIQLRCPDTHACPALSVGATATIWVDGFDARNQQIAALANPTSNPDTGAVVATFLSRDPTIASVSPAGIRAATVTARKSGTTWIVATRMALSDSLQIVVH
jgi:hypothetical protein